MTNKARAWRKSEGGVVGRYGDPRKALKGISLVVSNGDVNPSKQSFVVDAGLKLNQLKLKLIPSLDQNQLSLLPDEAYSALGICVVLRDVGVKRFTLIGEWSVSDLPENIPLDDFPEFERIVRDKMILSVGLVALEDSNALEVGTTLARKDFHIHTEASGNQFPHQFVDSTYFVDQGLPKTTSWFIHILNEEGDRSAEETFVVYINNELAEVASSKSADAVWAALAADVFTVLFQRLLRGQLAEEPVPGSILEQLDRQLSPFGQSIHNVAEWVRLSDTSRIMAISQSITKVNNLLRGAL